MVQINANIDDKLIERFRHVIYIRSGLTKGNIKKALEEAILDYIVKYEDLKAAGEKAKTQVIKKSI